MCGNVELADKEFLYEKKDFGTLAKLMKKIKQKTMRKIGIASGVGILVLFRENDDMKDNFRILAILYVSGVAWGIIIDALSKIIL